MAAILEDEDLIAQAQERERARLEEEARILAFQQQAVLPPPVWAGSPTAEIDAFNAAPGVISAPTTIGSEQYMNELARAQRGSGFINAEVSPTGEVLTPGYDPLKDFAALKAQQEATNLQRNQYVNSLVSGGATYAEAFRAGQGRYPQTGNDSMRLRVEQLALKTQPFTPRRVMSDGVAYDELRPGSFSRAPVTAPQRFVGGKVTPAIAAQAQGLAQEASLLRRALSKGVKEGLVPIPYSDEEKAKLREDLKRIEGEQQRLLSDPSVNPNVDQVGFSQIRQAWENPTSSRAPAPQAPVSETITVTTKEQFDKLPSGSVYVGKDGKKRRKP